MIVVNDLHLDVQRSAGTTPQSVFMLNQNIILWLQTMLTERPGEDLLINGDLFDRFDVSNQMLLQVYSVLLAHAMTGARIILVRGNHDYAKDSTKMPSIELLYNLLVKVCDVAYISTEEEEVGANVWVLPHLKNQDEFSAALKRMLAIKPHTLFLHCNYDNGFALESDHSLNISKEMVLKFAAVGSRLILGHEHHKRKPSEGNVEILGNQIPSSIYDCLGFKDKFYHTLDAAMNLIPQASWVNKAGYLEIDCQESFEEIPTNFQFIRVKGEVAPEDFPRINRKIVDLRKAHEAFVIGSALQITNTVADADIETSIEQMRQFKILPEILSCVKDKKQRAALEGVVMEMEATS